MFNQFNEEKQDKIDLSEQNADNIINQPIIKTTTIKKPAMRISIKVIANLLFLFLYTLVIMNIISYFRDKKKLDLNKSSFF